MDWRHSVRLLNMGLTPWQAHCFDYLEAHGRRFLIDYGFSTAEAMARDLWLEHAEREMAATD